MMRHAWNWCRITARWHQRAAALSVRRDHAQARRQRWLAWRRQAVPGAAMNSATVGTILHRTGCTITYSYRWRQVQYVAYEQHYGGPAHLQVGMLVEIALDPRAPYRSTIHGAWQRTHGRITLLAGDPLADRHGPSNRVGLPQAVQACPPFAEQWDTHTGTWQPRLLAVPPAYVADVLPTVGRLPTPTARFHTLARTLRSGGWWPTWRPRSQVQGGRTAARNRRWVVWMALGGACAGGVLDQVLAWRGWVDAVPLLSMGVGAVLAWSMTGRWPLRIWASALISGMVNAIAALLVWTVWLAFLRWPLPVWSGQIVMVAVLAVWLGSVYAWWRQAHPRTEALTVRAAPGARACAAQPRTKEDA